MAIEGQWLNEGKLIGLGEVKNMQHFSGYFRRFTVLIAKVESKLITYCIIIFLALKFPNAVHCLKIRQVFINNS